ncbi:hypothetical protein K505DRAFT_365481 [Melanomma pulvis-pyrius CBS 109.77]|uniref:Uncharacterized protein n=1 Tax=Melanomma pulvis-pyrius CBS 109.77 TaxID=1314802 RepID=A0A6A6X073_9PLEO|nr:hypothetical protein K505DRAFT_365481 [Melanomma pulvis-pyrius CBS 109.77]
MAWSGAMDQVGAAVQDLVDQRLEEKTYTSNEKKSKEHFDCIEWVISCSRTPE